ncbi:hypothetical protein GW755_04540 [bacterium]|nr:hypothetical protein [bacterium]
MFKFLLSLFKGKQVSSKTKRFVKATLARSSSVTSSNEGNLKRSYIIELDSMLGLILNDLYKKASIKDNLIKAKNRFSANEYQNLWNSHKVRNRIVHEPDGVFTSKELDSSILNFVKVLSKYK